MPKETCYIDRTALEHFCTQVFITLGLSEEEAVHSSEILVSADARGIASHGVARLWRYENGLRLGIMSGGIQPTVLRETPISLVLDANGAMGMSLSRKTMDRVIEKAKVSGAGFASIRNSNHFGIAGYYSEMAARNDMIGISMTNTAALGVPTFGAAAMFGTNPIAVALPGHGKYLFSLDMSTTTVTRGRIEVYNREGLSLPSGWAVDPRGVVTSDAAQLLDDMLFQRGGGLLPLGGAGEELGGHKGYGLAVLVDMMTAILSGGTFGKSVKDSEATSARVCHFFGAIRLDLFRDPDELKNDVDALLSELNETPVAEGQDRVLWAGQKEQEAEARANLEGVPLSMNVVSQLRTIGKDLGIAFPRLLSK